jgi:hypothetical protein
LYVGRTECGGLAKLSDRIVTSHQVVRRLVADLQMNQSMVHQVYWGEPLG